MDNIVIVKEISKLILDRKFDRVDSDITNDRFPVPSRVRSNYRVFEFREAVSSGEAISRMEAAGFAPANSHELLLWEGWDGRSTVAALGSYIWIDGKWDYWKYVIALEKDNSKKEGSRLDKLIR